jgi:hypothetical protein
MTPLGFDFSHFSLDIPADSAAPGGEAELCADGGSSDGKWRGMSNMVNANRVDSVVMLSNNPNRAETEATR